jgi:hypothetical protein
MKRECNRRERERLYSYTLPCVLKCARKSNELMILRLTTIQSLIEPLKLSYCIFSSIINQPSVTKC